MYYYSVGVCWTNNGHKWKQTCEPFLTNENTEGKRKQEHLYIYILPLLCGSIQKYLQKKQ